MYPVCTNQLLTPLRSDVLDELRWYFEQVRSHPTPSRSDDLDERFYEAREAFAAPRFRALYRAWKQDGEPVLAFDRLGAGRGERVMLTSDGQLLQEALGQTTPGRWSVLALPDD